MYRFSPITSFQEFNNSLEYILSQLEELSFKTFGEKLPINTLKVFAHYPDEYKFLLDHVKTLGEPANFNSSTSFYSKVDKQINGYQIDYVGVRVVDPYRLHVGCGDYTIDNLNEKKNVLLEKAPYVREFNEEMLEVWNPDLDVLGYIISDN